MKKNLNLLSFSVALAALAVGSVSAAPITGNGYAGLRVQHVLLISVDGLHASDLAYYVSTHPNSAMASLVNHGINYTSASSSKPSDSFPGLLTQLTGASPGLMGIYYDDSYDRNLLPPVLDSNGNPINSNTPGTEVLYDESCDTDLTVPNGGGGVNPLHFPRDPKTQKPVYPHSFLRVNTIFEVAHEANMRTAWCDKHQAYEIVNGPSGVGCDDFFAAESNSDTLPSHGTANAFQATGSELATQYVDGLRVAAVLHEINGMNSAGSTVAPVPAIFGLNFQAVSVAQKLIGNVNPDGSAVDPSLKNGGYVIDATTGQPVPSRLLLAALNYVDGALAKFQAALAAQNLTNSTMIILSAKHGQSPIDPTKLKSGLTGFNLKHGVDDLLAPIASSVGQVTTDDVGLIWLTDPTMTNTATSLLQKGQAAAYISKIYSTGNLELGFPNPATDSRVPDIIVQPDLGVIYSNSTSKDMEHGGFSVDDTNVALVVSNPYIFPYTIKNSVQTQQIAPTILAHLGLNPTRLQGVSIERTQQLPLF